MATPHIAAAKGQIAERILLPGDPLRAKFIAENWLTDVHQVSQVRNMLAFSGKWKGTPVSVMGTGMGMPSIGIYSWELCQVYNVQKLLRVGSCGAYTDQLNMLDLLLATNSWTDSSFAQAHNGKALSIIAPSPGLTNSIRLQAQKQGVALQEGTVHTSDVFYHGPAFNFRDVFQKHGALAVEMEAFALFYTAQQLGREAGALLTVSDSLVTEEGISTEAREQAFGPMIELALDAICQD
ncbi:purine-nucleoside phosphorylase [Aliidiomarina taiwanensis]|uniref:Uridine phosphorylase n=1 Tax=Aliidiomarina taiwanensis TaxID=946228 RepID=A0A432X180_9GAMM|nr:purine-nucleoside phosphorylase [Aliidiomarina taiwanensis]RUO39898.1 purine-nucleoside phosphorylase [Aliidiomarina taiwanensis]